MTLRWNDSTSAKRDATAEGSSGEKDWESRAHEAEDKDWESRERAAALTKLQEEALNIRDWAKVLPQVGKRIERLYDELVSEKPDKPVSVKWLVAIDVTTKDFGAGDDIAMRKAQLEALAAETKGKPVAIVAQFAIADVQKEQMSKYSWLIPHPYHIERYIISDGKMKQIDVVNSRGLAADCKDLLSFASDRFKGEKVAVLVDSHGGGNRGLSGDTGRATVPQFVDAVKKGLKGQKPDLIDFDSCFMGQNGVMEAMREITKHVVASAETEGGLGQDLATPIKALLKNPDLTGSDLGKTMVETARLQKASVDIPRDKPPQPTNIYEWVQQALTPTPEKPKRVPIKTLAHFDLKHYDNFRVELDELGKALCETIKDPKNRRVVDQLIETCPAYGDRSKLDVKGFVEKVVEAATSGKLSDPENQIRIHGGRLLDAHKQLVPQYSGFYEYGGRGGLTFYAPETWEVEYHRRARSRTWISDFKRDCENPPNLAKEKEREDYLKKLDREITRVSGEISRESSEETPTQIEAKLRVKEAQEAVGALRDAKTVDATFTALSAMRTAAKELEATDLYKTIIANHEKDVRKEVEAYYKKELVKPGSGWGDFRENLRR